mgnify:CR=1 FL=1
MQKTTVNPNPEQEMTVNPFAQEQATEIQPQENAQTYPVEVDGDIVELTLEELIDDLCDELKLHHVDRLQKGLCTLGQGFVFNDLLTNYERVADHCSNIAVAMIELESDSFDTHEYLNSVKEMKSDTFARYYEEYSRIYQI